MGQKTLIDPGPIETGRYRARLARMPDDLDRALILRARLFRGDPDATDRDRFDVLCRHLLVEDRATGTVLCTCRLMELTDGTEIGQSYAAQVYDLAPLAGCAGPMLEIGRFCIAPELRDADVMRLAWAALARIVTTERVEMLFGCTSFAGTDAGPYLDAFSSLHALHLAPPSWRPRVKAPDVVRFAGLSVTATDPKRAQSTMPPLLRSYLRMGGRVSDHAVRDHDLGTLHVFTGLEVGRVPAARRRALTAVAGG